MNYTVEVTDSGDFISGTGSKAPRTSTTLVSTFTAPINIADNAISKLVEWKAAAPNLFEVSFAGIRDISRLHCTAVQFSGAKLNLTRHNATKYFVMEGYQPADDVTITWREDSNFSVRKFHENWLASFYDRQNDHYISSTGATYPLAAKFRTATVLIQKMVGFNLYDYAELKLINMLPTQIPDLELNWANEAGLEYTLSYKVEAWEWNRK